MKALSSGGDPTGPAVRADVYRLVTRDGATYAFTGCPPERLGNPFPSGASGTVVPVKRDRIRVTTGTELDTLIVTVLTTSPDGLPYTGANRLAIGGLTLAQAVIAGLLDDAALTLTHHWTDIHGVSGSVILWDGFVGRCFPNSQGVQIEVYSLLDHLNTQVPFRLFKETCGWEFGSPQCGLTAVPGTFCDKTEAACRGYGNYANFGGFAHIPPANSAPAQSKEERQAEADALRRFWRAESPSATHTATPAPQRGGAAAQLQLQTSCYGKPVPILYGTRKIAGNLIFFPVESRHIAGSMNQAQGNPPVHWVTVAGAAAIALCDGAVTSIDHAVMSAGAFLEGRTIWTHSFGGLESDAVSWCWRDGRWYPNVDYLRWQGGDWAAGPPDLTSEDFMTNGGQGVIDVLSAGVNASRFSSLEGPFVLMPGSLGQPPYPWTVYAGHVRITPDYVTFDPNDPVHVIATGYGVPENWLCGYSGTAYIANDVIFTAKAPKSADLTNTDWIYDIKFPDFAFCVSGLGCEQRGPGVDAKPPFIIKSLLSDFAAWPQDRIGESLDGLIEAYCALWHFGLSMLLDVQKPAKEWLRDVLDHICCEAVWTSNGVQGVLEFAPIPIAAPAAVYDFQFELEPVDDMGSVVVIERTAHSETFNSHDVEYLDWRLMNGPTQIQSTVPGANLPPWAGDTRGALTGPYGDALDFTAFGSASAYDAQTIGFTEETDRQLPGSQLRRAPVFTAHGITNRTQAYIVAQMKTMMSLSMRNRVRLKLPWQYMRLDPLDFITVTDSAAGLNHYPVRVMAVEESADGESITVEGIGWTDVNLSGVATPANGSGGGPIGGGGVVSFGPIVGFVDSGPVPPRPPGF